MYLENFPTPRIFYPTREWKRIFIFFELLGTIWPFTAILVVELSTWTSHLFNFVISLLLGIGVYFISLLMSFFIFSLLIRPLRHIITSEGITFCSFGYRIYTPWNNIRGIGKSRYGAYHPPALLLQEPAVKGHVRDGNQLERATVERRWPIRKKDAPDDAIPLLFTVPADWQESELGHIIKLYAPQAFHPS
jgi:hypothetical protein